MRIIYNPAKNQSKSLARVGQAELAFNHNPGVDKMLNNMIS